MSSGMFNNQVSSPFFEFSDSQPTNKVLAEGLSAYVNQPPSFSTWLVASANLLQKELEKEKQAKRESPFCFCSSSFHAYMYMYRQSQGTLLSVSTTKAHQATKSLSSFLSANLMLESSKRKLKKFQKYKINPKGELSSKP